MPDFSKSQLAIFIGGKIRERREYLGVNQDDAAASIGMQKANLSKIESGTVRISAVDLAVLAEYLRVRIEYFYEEVGVVNTDVDILRSLPDDLREVAIEQIKALVDYSDRRLDSPNISTP